MDLALDIGNSAAKGALFAGGDLQRVFSLNLDPKSASAEDWRRALNDALAEAHPRRAGFSSVVPAATSRVATALRPLRRFNAPPLRVRADADLRWPFALAYRTPATLGADRLAAAAAAWTGYGEEKRPVVVLDAGTALTCEAVRAGPDGGVYEGGAITAGPALMARALADGTAQLRPPRLEDDLLPAPIGKTTEEALQSGLMHGLLDTAGGLLRRFTEALVPPTPVVVATGGWGALLYERLEGVDHHAPHLVLRGVHALLRLNESKR
jgi:type III pantothenate kinase